ncbi:MAG: hypothetical protein RLZZ480_558 [Candidatus Parcubacteria bacterium]|jgi:hypothetical protein
MEQEPASITEVGYDKEETQQQRLITVLNELEEEVEKQNSWQQVFMRGTLYGLGTVIGATILLALLGSLIAMAIDTFGIANIPYLGDFVRNIVVEQLNSR